MAKVLLSDGFGLSSRQAAGLLGRAGHHVETAQPAGVSLTKHTRWVRRTHPVPPFGEDPFAWYEAILEILAANDFDVLLPVQEETTMLARFPERVRALGTSLAVPPFEALKRVQDKISAAETLRGLGVPQPSSQVVADAGELRAAVQEFPVFVKLPIGTASAGTYRVDDAAGLDRLGAELTERGVFAPGEVLVQQEVSGRLAMIVAVFDHGRLVSSHVSVRTREGIGGGASNKCSITVPAVTDHVIRLGEGLSWHGALSLDAILTEDGPLFIDVNPRLIEPANAHHAGTDLLASLLDISVGVSPPSAPPSRAGVRTHQFLLAALEAASAGRRAVLAELCAAVSGTGWYRDSAEELTPVGGDPLAVVPLLGIVGSILVDPARAPGYATGAVSRYSLNADGWRRICAPAAVPSC